MFLIMAFGQLLNSLVKTMFLRHTLGKKGQSKVSSKSKLSICKFIIKILIMKHISVQ